MAQEYKLKGLTKIELKDMETKEVEVEGIEKGKVLLVNSQGKIHAMTATCSHFGLPLAKGVVAPDGRITCAFHGACFNIATGDVEDSPAPEALHKFDIIEKDGAVYIKGTEKDIKGASRKVNIKTEPKSSEKVVIVGSGSGAFGAILKLRELGFNGKVTVISTENQPIDRTKLSKALITDESKLFLEPKEWYSEGSIDFVKDEVTAVEFSEKSVKTKSGKDVSYTKLILATGGTPKNLPLPGFKDLSNIFKLRQVSDTKAIMDAVGDKGKKIVVVGSSFIGMEVGNALAKDNTVTIVGMENVPLERVMGEEVGKIFIRMFEKNGVKFKLGASVDSAVGSSSVRAVKLKDGTELEADLVILGIGVAPATEYLKDNSSVQLEKDGSISVDENYAVKGLSDVYAIGDIASYPYHGPGGHGKAVRIEHWNVAQNQGRAVGQIIATGEKPKKFIPIFWSALGTQLRYCGNTPNGFDDLIMTGKPDENKFAAYYTKGEDVVAVASMSMDPIMVKCAELMRRNEMLSRSDLKAGKDPLQVGI